MKLPSRAETKSYILLNDQPVHGEAEDLLDTERIAEGIASMLVASRGASPFVFAIDAGWGMGKSTLLRLIGMRIPDDSGIIKLHFNAWTAEGTNTLEGLIKAVLVKLDPNVLRRWVRQLGRSRRVVLFTRVGLAVGARVLGASRLVDELWNQLTIDARSRNELRDVIHGMLSDWVAQDGKRDPDRSLVVFIDDLDLCSDEVVVKVCEAVKLYLDAPGLIFVLACDQAVLARGVSSSARGGMGEGRSYLEKIIQVVYRMPPPEKAQLEKLIHGYAQRSGTAEVIGGAETKTLVEQAGRNPRKIKRIINSFVLEYELVQAWRRSPLSSQQLVTAILIQHLYAPFYDVLVNEDSGEDPIGDFLDYAEIAGQISEPPMDPNDQWWEIVRRTFHAHRVPAPSPPSLDHKDSEEAGQKLSAAYERLERELPEDFSALARNSSFVALLRGVGDTQTRKALHAQLVRRPLATEITVNRQWSAEQRNQLALLVADLYREEISRRRLMEMIGLDRAIISASSRPIDGAYE